VTYDITYGTNIEELRRFFGIVNFLGKFLPHLATICEPLRNLTKKDVSWNWSIPQETAFNSLKDMITTQGVGFALYDPTRELTPENDASEYGLGSCMMQEVRPISFASRTLSDAERRHAQIEKDMLAVAYCIEKTTNSHLADMYKSLGYRSQAPGSYIVSKPIRKYSYIHLYT